MSSVALVVLDTVRKDAFDQQFGWLSGRRFDHAWSTAKWTMPAHASLFTGKYASEVGVNARSEGLDCPDSTLAERLSAAGYTTRAFSANLMASPVFGFDRGFDSFDGTWRVNANSKGLSGWRELLQNGRSGIDRYLAFLKLATSGQYRIGPSIAAGLLRRLSDSTWLPDGGARNRDDGATTLLDSLQQDVYSDADFLFVNLMEAHAPYAPPKPYRTSGDPSYDEVAATLTSHEPDARIIREAYDGSVRYLSDRYRQIFAALKRRFEYVITLGDHGELFGEHGSWRHLHGVYPELTHVPLVISGAGLSGTCSKTVSLLDVHRTILDLLHVDGSSRGQVLLEEVEDRPAFVEYEGLRTARIEMMREAGYSEQLIRSYDRPLAGLAMDGGYYGYETLDGWTEHGTPPESVSDPHEQLRAFRSSLPTRSTPDRTATDVSEAVQARLEDLGYA
ncbi:sulfatase-like hydrolase/transferase [Halalkalicoccus subterraneus]|uniref:sulfatase-like hydrolase/transferase n=1 Tax=Halalkalicoccus subterraneus TaxID=2675002 RepID=UPI000EFCDAA0|nr:sulfatase-like hydrolase/transferase [Halalkalicoccus subterraneus]